MRKYKLYSQCELSKNIITAHGWNKKCNIKLLISSFVTTFGIVGVNTFTGFQDSIILNSILITSSLVLSGCNIVMLNDTKNLVSSNKKLDAIEKSLKEKNINIDFFYDFKYFGGFKDDNSSLNYIVFMDDKKIINLNNKNFFYIDSEKEIDITDEVNKSLLSKRKYNKYIKSKENDESK